MIKKFLAVMAAALVGVIATPGIGQAAWSQCTGPVVCFWSDANAGGSFKSYSATYLRENGGAQLWRGGMNNISSSGQNNTSTVVMFDATTCNVSDPGWKRNIIPGQTWNGAGSDWNDRFSAINLQFPTGQNCNG